MQAVHRTMLEYHPPSAMRGEAERSREVLLRIVMRDHT